MNMMLSTIARMVKSRRSFALLLLGLLIAVRLLIPRPLKSCGSEALICFNTFIPGRTRLALSLLSISMKQV